MASLQIIFLASVVAITVASTPDDERMLSPSPSPRILSAPTGTPKSSCAGYACPATWNLRPIPGNIGCVTTGCTDTQCCLQPTPPPPVTAAPPPVAPPPVAPPTLPTVGPVPTPSPIIVKDVGPEMKKIYDEVVDKIRTGGKAAWNNFEKMPLKERAGIIAGVAGAGTAIVVGSAAGAAAHAKAHAAAQPGQVVNVLETVMVAVTPAPPANGLIARYSVDGGKAIAPVMGSSATPLAVATFILFGAIFLGVSGLAVYKLRSKKQESNSVQVMPDALEDAGLVEESPLLA